MAAQEREGGVAVVQINAAAAVVGGAVGVDLAVGERHVPTGAIEAAAIVAGGVIVDLALGDRDRSGCAFHREAAAAARRDVGGDAAAGDHHGVGSREDAAAVTSRGLVVLDRAVGERQIVVRETCNRAA